MSRTIFAEGEAVAVTKSAEGGARHIDAGQSTSSPALMGGLRFTAKRGHCQHGKLSHVNLDQKKSVAVKGTRNFVNLPILLAVAKLNYDRGTSTPVP